MGKWGKADKHSQVGGKMMCYVKRWFLKHISVSYSETCEMGGVAAEREGKEGREARKQKRPKYSSPFCSFKSPFPLGVRYKLLRSAPRH